MSTLDIRITRILYIHNTSGFDFYRSYCANGGAWLPMCATHTGNECFLWHASMNNFFAGTSSHSVVLFPEAPSITWLSWLEHVTHHVRNIATPTHYHDATAVVHLKILIYNYRNSLYKVHHCIFHA